MAVFKRQYDVAQAFRNDPQLQQFLLDDVTPTGRVLGTGSYGSVVEVNYRKLVCAGKKLHEALLDVGVEGVDWMVQMYLQECQLMSSLRHPNITLFLGLCFLPETQLPLLVMERLETSLNNLLEHIPNLPLSLKYSVLKDIASGLLYLHKMQPPIIHRDLTSNNILLTSSLVAKITDLGNSRMVDLRPGQMAKTLTKYPGTLVYMPPEALDDRHRYGPSLDIFSFGHLALYTITQVVHVGAHRGSCYNALFIQVFPGDLLAYTFPNPDNPEDVRARNELERREQYVQLLEAQISRLHPDLVQLVKQCLHNVPTRRPSSEELLTRLQGISGQVEGEYGGPFKLDMVRVRLAKEVKEKDRRIEELTHQQERHEAELRRVDALMADIQNKDDQIKQLQDEIATKNDQVGGLMKQLEELVAEIQMKNDRLAAKEKENTRVLQSKEAEINRLVEAPRKLQQTQRQRVQQGSLKLPLQLAWRHGPSMPFGMSSYVQSVVVQGKVYVGGGLASTLHRKHTVMEYNSSSEKWSQLPQWTTRNFALAKLHNQLVLVGGMGHDDKASKVVGVWVADGRKWITPYPKMSTARFDCSAVTYNEWLVIAGGVLGPNYFSSVEVLNTTTKVWQAGPQLPAPVSAMKTAIVEDTFYFMGGYANGHYIDKVYSASFQTLILHLSKKGEPETWKEITGLQLTCSTPLSIGGHLLAVGGRDKDGKSITGIQLYQPDTGDWIKIEEVPSPCFNCTCAVNGPREVLLLQESGRMDIASFD